ncbi:galactoside alpha-(1,2)-fucosyltransferase 2-like [Haliotis rufescens]|uniref:galactoside alpha-(1,2)-fucosyltransferase 2-like n=1 Tax=Haliotis rufescens TaxID=6454 RepID=UPI00201F77DB|nr:galactoside alpha-(1,2)-fucosyltransferase 2-like [Haliotis rufescens]
MGWTWCLKHKPTLNVFLFVLLPLTTVCIYVLLSSETLLYSQSQQKEIFDPERTAIVNAIVNVIAVDLSTTNANNNIHTIPAASIPTRSQLVSTCKDPFLSEFKRGKIYLCNRVFGGLGNQMFSYASAYAIAKRNNRIVVTEKSRSLNRVFSLKAELVDNFCVCDGARNAGPRWSCRFDESFFNKSLTQGVNFGVNTYLQSWMYFRHVEADIRRQFTFSDSYRKAAREIIQKTLSAGGWESATVIAVHIRRGDITKVPRFINHGYRVPTENYFYKAFDYFRKKVSNPVFFLFSDNFPWTKSHLNGSDVIYMEGHNATTDMALMTQCTHTIMSVGTFGWWAAYLAGGTTIYYRHPARNGSSLRTAFSKDYSDFFMPQWIGME